jgi:ribosomal protein S18 acetylase RimI-like enzyme
MSKQPPSEVIEFGWMGPEVNAAQISDIYGLLEHLTDKDIDLIKVAKNVLAIANSNHQVLIHASNLGNIVGMATLTVKTIPTERTGYIDDVVVDPLMRGRGVARGLMNFIEMYAQEIGIEKLQLTSNSRREAALSLYTSLGYELKDTNFLVKDLSPLS